MDARQGQAKRLTVRGAEVDDLFFNSLNGAGERLFHRSSLLRNLHLIHGTDFKAAMAHADGETQC